MIIDLFRPQPVCIRIRLYIQSVNLHLDRLCILDRSLNSLLSIEGIERTIITYMYEIIGIISRGTKISGKLCFFFQTFLDNKRVRIVYRVINASLKKLYDEKCTKGQLYIYKKITTNFRTTLVRLSIVRGDIYDAVNGITLPPWSYCFFSSPLKTDLTSNSESQLSLFLFSPRDYTKGQRTREKVRRARRVVS